MNPRQRRAVLLLILAFAGLVAVFFLVQGYVADVRREIGPKQTVLALTKPAPPYQQLTDDMVEERQIPERYMPRAAVTDRGQLVGLQPNTELAAGSILQEGMLAPQPSIQEGQRELAILVDAKTGVAGKVQPGSQVDIVGTFPGDDERIPNTAEVVVQNARITDVGATQVQGGNSEQPDPSAVVPVTFALTPRQVLNVQYAETFAGELRLALRRPGDESKLTAEESKLERRGRAFVRGGR